MQIALITSMKYGLTQFIYRDIDALWRKGHGIDIFTLHNQPGLYNPRPEWPVWPVSPARIVTGLLDQLRRQPRRYLRLVREALQTRSLVDLAIATGFADRLAECDIIFSYFGDHKLFVGYYGKQLVDRPLVVTIRAYELYNNPNPRLFPRALRGCDRVITITEYNRDVLVERYGLTKENIDIVRQIVDLDAFRFRKRLKILMVAFFAEKKGHDILFKAFKELGRDDVELWIVGDVNRTVRGVDPRQQVSELGIEEHVAFFGAQSGNALRALYNECDLFCLPSRADRTGDQEGFPNVIAEAMAFGKPVVSTYHAGIPEAIDRWLVDENSVDQLAKALDEACSSARLRQEAGARNRERAEVLFSPQNNDVLESILARYC